MNMYVFCTVLILLDLTFIHAKEQYYSEIWPPMPYAFGYEVRDLNGNEQYRKERSDGNRVTGSYGYWGPDGIYRHVDYVADHLGFRANVRTSEPGTANEDPASVRMLSNPISASRALGPSFPPPFSNPPPPILGHSNSVDTQRGGRRRTTSLDRPDRDFASRKGTSPDILGTLPGSRPSTPTSPENPKVTSSSSSPDPPPGSSIIGLPGTTEKLPNEFDNINNKIRPISPPDGRIPLPGQGGQPSHVLDVSGKGTRSDTNQREKYPGSDIGSSSKSSDNTKPIVNFPLSTVSKSDPSIPSITVGSKRPDEMHKEVETGSKQLGSKGEEEATGVGTVNGSKFSKTSSKVDGDHKGSTDGIRSGIESPSTKINGPKVPKRMPPFGPNDEQRSSLKFDDDNLPVRYTQIDHKLELKPPPLKLVYGQRVKAYKPNEEIYRLKKEVNANQNNHLYNLRLKELSYNQGTKENFKKIQNIDKPKEIYEKENSNRVIDEEQPMVIYDKLEKEYDRPLEIYERPLEVFNRVSELKELKSPYLSLKESSKETHSKDELNSNKSNEMKLVRDRYAIDDNYQPKPLSMESLKQKIPTYLYSYNLRPLINYIPTAYPESVKPNAAESDLQMIYQRSLESLPLTNEYDSYSNSHQEKAMQPIESVEVTKGITEQLKRLVQSVSGLVTGKAIQASNTTNQLIEKENNAASNNDLYKNDNKMWRKWYNP